MSADALLKWSHTSYSWFFKQSRPEACIHITVCVIQISVIIRFAETNENLTTWSEKELHWKFIRPNNSVIKTIIFTRKRGNENS